MSNLPKEYIIQKFYQFAGSVKYIKGTNTYRGSCPGCREGKSWGKKTRLNYLPEKNLIHCFNCNKSWTATNWILEQTGVTYSDLVEESKDFDMLPVNDINTIKSRPVSDVLPEDSINLFDPQQVKYYFKEKVVIDALLLIKQRRLDTAINKPRALYVSINDYIHKNRLIIPFYDYRGKLIYYQSRTIYKADEINRPKYMCKLNDDKSVFGIDMIDPQLDYLFIFEGPIDSMFVKNGLAMAGISISDFQETQLDRYCLYKKVWVLDNEIKENPDVRKQANRLLEHGERVFFWPQKYKGIKDINDLCVLTKKNGINPEFFVKNSYESSEGLLELAKIVN